MFSVGILKERHGRIIRMLESTSVFRCLLSPRIAIQSETRYDMHRNYYIVIIGCELLYIRHEPIILL